MSLHHVQMLNSFYKDIETAVNGVIDLLCAINNILSVDFERKTHIKRNVLIIVIDDMRHLTDQNILLPNIQKLAVNSIVFQNAFAQQALCAPSRNSMLTGRRPDILHLYDFYSYWRDAVGNFSTFPQLFKLYEYDTFSVGKIFHPGISSNFTDDFPYSWSEKPFHPPSEKYKDAAVCKNKHTNELQKNLLCPITINNQPDGTLPDIESVNYAIDLIKTRNTSKPYLLAVGFHKPHIPLKYPHKYLKKVPISAVQPPSMPDIPKRMPVVAWHPWTDVRHRDDINNLNISFPFGTMPPKWTLKIRQNYYAALLYIDDLIGNLLKNIDLSNTIVVLTSDHGWSLGENGLWAKYSNFDVALRVPLLFKIPNKQPKSISTPVELIDIFPTLLELAGLDTFNSCKDYKSNQCLDGKSLVPLMNNKPNEHQSKSFAISQYPRPSEHPVNNSDKPRLKDIKIMGYSIRTKRYRCTEWIAFDHKTFSRNWSKLYGVELYDHIVDEEESNNVYDVHKYKNVKFKLSKLLRKQVDLQ
ncbi:iduronate 2-sulfatase [Nymphalis io]|uniref:iduronate 2-sulfatase n=1 Tax=Inachis io TaxID=171585 RepID=UPI002169556B|nr:iduronate 2-sulfatase [Nymphalis io]